MDEELARRLEDAQLWAAKNKCFIELDGQVGFGRECVGVMQGSNYVDTPGSKHNDSESRGDEYVKKVEPPEHVAVTAYHKHDCLCVLGRGEGSIIELLDWIDKLRLHGAYVKIEDREYEPGERNAISMILHGLTRAVIEFEE